MTQPPMLSNLFHPSDFVIEGRAVAAYGGGPGCVMALNSSASGAISAGGNTTVNMPSCTLISDSSASDAIKIYGSNSVAVNGACGVGGISANSGLADDWNATGSGCTVSNPYSGLFVPSDCDPAQTIACAAQTTTNAATVTYNPGIYHGLTVNAGQSVTLNPGVYIIDGGSGTGNNLNFSGGSVTGSGVTFVLTTTGNKYPGLSINGNASLAITAPTSGPFSGVVLYDTTRKNPTR